MAKKGVGLDSAATQALSGAQVPYAVHQFDAQSPGDSPVEGLPVDAFDHPNRVFQTVLIKGPEERVCAVVPITNVIDLALVAAAMGVDSVTEAGEKRTLRETGYGHDVLTPVGLKEPLATLVDLAALDFQTILISAGQAGYVIELSPSDLIEATAARTAPLSRRL